MKTKIIIILTACSICLFTACSGDRTPQDGKDTGVNTYKVKKDTSKMDTSKVTSGDNSATGGAGNTTDTAKKVKH